ncbi:MAG TPA: hypothetical protein VEB20_01495 [Azospirillaceae bacterium]|nr:hypothetical protein [Azospirillaceae bacterium]
MPQSRLSRIARAALLATALAGLPGCLLMDAARMSAAQQSAAHIVRAPLPLEVPFRQAGGLVLVPVTVTAGPGRQAMLDFVLDTGAPVTVLLDGPGTAALALDLSDARKLGDPDEASTPVGAFRFGFTLDFGPLSLEGMPAVGIPLSTMPCTDRVAGIGFQGVIGRDLFRRFVVEMDFGRQVLRLHDPAAYRRDPGVPTLPLTEENGHVFAEGTVRLADGRETAGLVHLDTGSTAGLNVVAASAGLAPPEGAAARRVCQVNGLLETREAGLSGVTLGGAETAGVPTSFILGSKPMTDRHVASAGMGLLGRYDLVIDYPGATLGLKPRPVSAARGSAAPPPA